MVLPIMNVYLFVYRSYDSESSHLGTHPLRIQKTFLQLLHVLFPRFIRLFLLCMRHLYVCARLSAGSRAEIPDSAKIGMFGSLIH